MDRHVTKKPKLTKEDDSANKENASQPPSSSSSSSSNDDFRAILLGGRLMEQYAAAGARNLSLSSSESMRSHSSHFDSKEHARKPQDMRITEVLAANFAQQVVVRSSSKLDSRRKMEGDIPNLGLHASFFVEGVRIGWPFPAIMPPQRQMALHLIKALKNRRHVVLESPTGTGKSAAILCSVLAWQRYHHKMNANRTAGGSESTPRIIYCSRTHSQVAQMVASLRKTPYRPSMSVLGSRERLCIHQKILPRGGGGKQDGNISQTKKLNVNHECRVRVGNTEEMRKYMHKNRNYNDDDPPEEMERDLVDAPPEEDAEREANAPVNARKSEKPYCPHYRQLTTSRIAELAHEQFVPQAQQVNCCVSGGEQSKYGSHDIEDLVAFGMDPHVRKNVAVYRRSTEEAFGMTLAQDAKKRISIAKLAPSGAVAMEGSFKQGDEIVRVNGRDAADWSVHDIANEMKQMEADPLLLDTTQNSVFQADESEYSTHSACPYYVTRAIAKHAELVFAPYNYVLDPFIRKSLDIDLSGTVVVLDEAHNVEDTLRESGSGKYGEFELCEIVVMLAQFSAAQRGKFNEVELDATGEEGEKKDVSELAHELLLFLEGLLTFIMEAKTRFEANPGNGGARKAIADWQKFHTPDDTEFEMTYDGPSGSGVRGKPVGCQTFFDKLGLTFEKAETFKKYGEGLDAHIRSKEGWEPGKYSNALDKLNEIITMFSYALEHPEHYYVATVAKANGNLEYAAGMSSGELRAQRDSPFKRKPQHMPLIPPRTAERPNALAERCLHTSCREAQSGPHFEDGGIRHGSYCNGASPPWEACLVLELLTPARFMTELAEQCRTVVLASGSLAPIASLCGELGLLGGENEDQSKVAQSKKPDDSAKEEKKAARLQLHPRPLEANHVINLEKQLMALSIGFAADGSPLTVNYQSYNKPEFMPKLGDAIASVIEAIPNGGVLVFLPSYSLLRKCVKSWNPNTGQRGWNFDYGTTNSVWDRFEASKGKVIVEPTGSQTKFEEARDEYADTIRTEGSCILLAVFRGKMSEGISFNDANARGVICVGIPYPNARDRSITAKKCYNDEQRRLHKRNDILPGNEWYSQQAYRAVAQALGRCIRHAADYGTVVLMDSRYCDNGEPVEGVCSAHRNLPKWMRFAVRNLSRRAQGDPYGKSIPGGWKGLKVAMRQFFLEAPVHAQSVLEQQQENLRRSRGQNRDVHRFNRFDQKTGDWTGEHSLSSAPVTQSQGTPAVDGTRRQDTTDTNTASPRVVVSSNTANGKVAGPGSADNLPKQT